MRKQKIEELRIQALGKRKGRMLIPTVTAKGAGDRPLSASLSTGGQSTTRATTPSTSSKAGQGTGFTAFHRTTTLSMMDIGAEAEEKEEGGGQTAPPTPSRGT